MLTDSMKKKILSFEKKLFVFLYKVYEFSEYFNLSTILKQRKDDFVFLSFYQEIKSTKNNFKTSKN